MAKSDTKCPRCHQRSKRTGIVSWRDGATERVTPKYDCTGNCRNRIGKVFEFTIKENGSKVDILDLVSETAPVS